MKYFTIALFVILIFVVIFAQNEINKLANIAIENGIQKTASERAYESIIESMREVPRCPEDAVIVGYGKYKDGRWSDYQCVPLDDLKRKCECNDSIWERLYHDFCVPKTPMPRLQAPPQG